MDCCVAGMVSTALHYHKVYLTSYPEKNFYSQLIPNPKCHTAATMMLLIPQIKPWKYEHLERIFAVLCNCSYESHCLSCCFFNVQSIASKSGLLSSSGPGILRFISIFLHLEYQVEPYQPFTWGTVQPQHFIFLYEAYRSC